MVAAIALLLAHQGSTITFESTAITVQGFCKELSKQTGKKYVAWDEVQGDLIAVHLDAAPIEDVLKHLEFVERAKLDFDGTTNNLRPDFEERTKLKTDWIADRVKAIKKIQAHLRTLLREKPLDDAQYGQLVHKISAQHELQNAFWEAKNYTAMGQSNERIHDLQLELPVGKALLKLVLAIPAEEFAAVPFDEAGVWSTSPTQVELPCPSDSNSILQELASDQTTWSEASDKYITDNTSYLARLSPANSKPVVVLRLEVPSGIFSLESLTLTGFDSDGRRSFEMSQSFSADEDQSSTAPRLLPLDPNPVTVSIPTQTERFIRLWSTAPRDSDMAAWASDPTFREAYFNPEKNDPVGLTFGSAMVEVAKARKEQMVAAEQADFAFRFPAQVILKGRVTDRALEEAFFENGAKYRRVLYAHDKSWITVRPGIIGVAKKQDFDRPALGKLLRTARDNQTVNLMDVAKYAAGTSDRMSYRCLKLLPFLVPDLSGTELLKPTDWELKAFLGRLDEVQISAAQQPGGLALASCTPFQLERLAKEVQLTRLTWRGQTDVWRSYPTDGLPTGLPGGGVLHLSVDSGTALRARQRMDGGRSANAYGSVSDIATYLSQIGPIDPDSRLHLVGISPQLSQSYVFNFVFPEDVTTTATLKDYRPAGNEVKSVDELDEPLRSELKTAIDKVSKK